jgi:oxepin-CoA hydrolase/3-oxo-5,6-dehydrosuberyl-CoA semialdehyde dehydrogenase
MHAPDALSFNQLEVGREWVSQPRQITAGDIASFSTLTGDNFPTYEEPADEAPAGPGTARGLFGPSVATGLALNAPPVRTIAFLAIRDWRFAAPINAGDALRIRNRVQAVTPRGVGRRGEVAWRVEIVNQRDEIVQAGVIVSLVEGDAVARRCRGDG